MASLLENSLLGECLFPWFSHKVHGGPAVVAGARLHLELLAEFASLVHMVLILLACRMQEHGVMESFKILENC